jgi:hypothetical protein
MELFGFHVLGTRDKDKEIEQLRAYNRQLRDQLDRNQADYDRLDRQHQDLESRFGELQDDLGEAWARYNDLEGRFADAQGDHESVKAELERLQELAPYQVRNWDLTVRKACMTLEEAMEEVSSPHALRSGGNVYVTKREGDHNRMMSAEEIREALGVAVDSKGAVSEEAAPDAVEGDEPERRDDELTSSKLYEWDLRGETHMVKAVDPANLEGEGYGGDEEEGREVSEQQDMLDEMDYQRLLRLEAKGKLTPEEQAYLDQERGGTKEQREQERACAMDEDQPEQTRQPEQPCRREQPQAPPPHVLYRSPGPSRGMER